MDFSSEEDVKVKLVLPHLTALGFQADELHFERSFQLTLGLATHKIDTERQFTRASGRLDILVTRDNNNLFVVEVKKGHSAFSEADMLQATSYARLVHPVAPFSLLISEK